MKAVKSELEQDADNHATYGEGFEAVKNKVLAVEDLEMKRANLQAMLKSLPTEASFRESLVFNLKRLLISDFALRYNFKKVLFGTNA